MSLVVDTEPSTGPRARIERLFPFRPDSSGHAGRRLLGYVLGFSAAMGFLLLTPAGRSHLTHMWAEDGARFLVDALNHPVGVNLVTPYAGYLHLVPRLCAQLVALLPLGSAAAGIAVLAAAVRSGIALLVFAATGGHVRARWIRLGLAASVILLPAGNGEALNNIADLHWFLLYAAFWGLLWRPVGWRRAALSTGVVVLAVGSSVLALGLVPLAAARVALPRWRDRMVGIGFGIGAIAQVSAMVAGRARPGSRQPFDVGQALLASLMRVPLVTFTGPSPVHRLYEWFGYWPGVLALLCALAVAVVGVVRGRAAGRFVVIAAVLVSALSILVELYVNWWPGLQIDQPGVVLINERYSTAPCLFLLTAVAVGLDVWPWRGHGFAMVARLAIPVVIVASIGVQLVLGRWLVAGPNWRDAVAAAARQCAGGGTVGIVHISPPGWYFGMPCTRLVTQLPRPK